MLDTEVTHTGVKSEKGELKAGDLHLALDSLKTASKGFEMHFCNAIADNIFEELELKELRGHLNFMREYVGKVKLSSESGVSPLPEWL